MKFWDASAIIPLCVEEQHTTQAFDLLKDDNGMVLWWGGYIECVSAFARLRRDGRITTDEEDNLRGTLKMLSKAWTEILPCEDVKSIAMRLLLVHALRAADALQLAAALVWAGKTPSGQHFVCFDERLKDAARKEGFTVR